MIKTDITYHFTLLLLICTLLSNNLNAQPKVVPEEDVNVQKIFIDATKDKLLGKYEEAIVLYKEVLKLDKDNHAAAYEMARLYEVLDKDEKALTSIKMACALDSGNEWYKMLLADLYHKNNKNSEAASIYEQLSKANPTSEFFYSKWAFHLISAKEIDKGIKVYNDYEKKFGVTEEVVRKKHALYLGQGNPKKAEAELKKLIKRFPRAVEYHHLLAGFYTQTGQDDKATETYNTILELDPENAKAKIAIAGKNKSGNNDITYLTSLIPVFEKQDVDIDLKIKELFPYINKVAETKDDELKVATLNLAKILSEVHPEEAKSFSIYGDLLYYTGNTDDAVSKYKKTIELDKTVFTVWEQLMYIYHEKDDMESLLNITNDAMDLFPNKAKAYYFNGIANSAMNQHTDAISIFKQSLMMSAKNPRLKLDILTKMGQSYFQTKKYEKAQKSLENALDMNPKDPAALEYYGDVLNATGKTDEAIKQWKASMKNGNKSKQLQEKINKAS